MYFYKLLIFFIAVTINFTQGSIPKRDPLDLNKYYSYGKILRYVETIATEDKQKFRVQRIGKTYEGRDIVLVKASKNFDANNPIILVDGGAHAREWAAVATVLALLDDIRLNKTGLLEYTDWYIIPVVNPDGYEYTRSTNRSWRKNRSKHKGSECIGSDVNRNFDFHWAESGTSTDPCDFEIYPGPFPFSEEESKAVASVMTYYAKNIKLYLSIHAYGNYMVYPFGYTGDVLPENWRKLDFFARNVTDEAGKIFGTRYSVMSAGQWYPGAGGSDDYALSVVKIPYSYTIELTKNYKFEFPEHLLGSLANETKIIFKSAGTLIHKEFSS